MTDKKEPGVMLAPNTEVKFDSDKLRWPLLGSAKLDGMRIKVTPDGLFSRTHKKQGLELHDRFAAVLREVQKQNIVLDCELWSPSLAFNEIMRTENQHKLALYVFDMMSVDEWYGGTERPFLERVDEYQQWIQRHWSDHPDWVQAVDQAMLREPSDLDELYSLCLKRNLEGCVTRPAFSKYKHGRATVNEGLMFKWKKWVTVDAKVIGFKPATVMKEDAPRETNEMGGLKQVHSKEHRVETDEIGSIQVRTLEGVEFFATGSKDMTVEWPANEAELKAIWMGHWVEVKYQETGTKDKPRMPAILRFRPDLDKNPPKKPLPFQQATTGRSKIWVPEAVKKGTAMFGPAIDEAYERKRREAKGD